MSGISRDELVRRLAEVSHLSYVRQENRDHGVPLEELSLEVNDHDRERAADIVAELERLGVFQPGVAPPEPPDAPPVQPDPPPSAESRRRQITDIWGNPIGARKRRGR